MNICDIPIYTSAKYGMTMSKNKNKKLWHERKVKKTYRFDRVRDKSFMVEDPWAKYDMPMSWRTEVMGRTKRHNGKQEAHGPHRSPEKTVQINKHIIMIIS